MIYTYKYKSPLGHILLAADEVGITGLWFEGQKYFANTLPDKHIPQETEILTEAKKWLDVYFSGEEPKFTPPLHPDGSTFRQAVWKILLQIPYEQIYKTKFPFSLNHSSAEQNHHHLHTSGSAGVATILTQVRDIDKNISILGLPRIRETEQMDSLPPAPGK